MYETDHQSPGLQRQAARQLKVWISGSAPFAAYTHLANVCQSKAATQQEEYAPRETRVDGAPVHQWSVVHVRCE